MTSVILKCWPGCSAWLGPHIPGLPHITGATCMCMNLDADGPAISFLPSRFRVVG